jgi:MFS family permease
MIPETKPQSLRRSWYVVAVLMLAYISSFIDRQVLALLVEPIKRDFGISDTQVGLLIGFSFALFYTFLGIPIGRLADRKNRKAIIVVGITIWSLMTALCGLAGSFWPLFFARMGVGVGEATLSPSAYSLISDLFPKQKLGTAMGVYNMGIYLGSGLSILLVALILKLISVEGMWTLPLIGAVHPWQTVFFWVGLPGLVIVVLIMFTVQEPVRKTVVGAVVPMSVVMAYFRANRVPILSLSFGMAFMSMASYGATAWTPSVLARLYGFKPANAGVLFGLIVTVCATTGVITGGRLADMLTKQGVINGKLRICTLVMLAASVVSGLMFISAMVWPVPPFAWQITLTVLFAFTSSMPFGAAVAALQEIVPGSMRATFSAAFLFIVNFIGLGLGPLLPGLLNDRVFGRPETILQAMTLMMVVACLASWRSLAAGLMPFETSIENARLTQTVVNA